MEHCRSHRCCTGTLCDQLLLFDQSQNCSGDLVVGHSHNVVHILLDILESVGARFLDGDTVGNGGNGVQTGDLVVVNGLVHAGCTACLYAVNLDIRVQLLNGKRHAGDQSAAADRHNDCVHVCHLIQNFQTDGALSGNDVFVVKGVYKSVVVFLLELYSLVVGIVIDTLDHADLCTVTLGSFYLGDRSTVRQADESLHVVLCCSQSHTLCVVAGRAGDDTPCLFFFCQLGHHVIGTANLERTGDLQVLCLEKQIAVRTEFRCLNQIRFPDHAPEHVACLIDFIQCQHG